MATRLLLTLLALLAGLAAQLTPAQARSGAAVGVEIGAVAMVAASQRSSPSQMQVRALQSVRERRKSAISAPVLQSPAVSVAPVLVGIDRARE